LFSLIDATGRMPLALVVRRVRGNGEEESGDVMNAQVGAGLD
jgi:hypothetical protein